MTSTNYCSSCGNRIEQNGVRANFCSKCGQDLKTLKKTVATATVEDEEVQTEGTLNLEEIKKGIKISVEVDAPPVVTLGDVISQAKASGQKPEAPISRQPDNLPEGKDLLKTIQKECASSRNVSKEAE